MTNVEALQSLYVALGGDAADVADATTITAILNAIAAKYEGANDATTNAEAIANIADVAGSISPSGGGNVKTVLATINNTTKFTVYSAAFNGEIDWGDGSEHTVITGSPSTGAVGRASHTYESVGEYIVTITIDEVLSESGAIVLQTQATLA